MIDDEGIELKAKLKLDTTEAEKELDALANKKIDSAFKKSDSQGLKDATKGVKELFSGPHGVNNIGKIARGALGGLQGLSSSLVSVLSKSPKVAGVVTLVLAAVGALIKMFSDTDSFKVMVDSLRNSLEHLKPAFRPVIQFLAELAIMIDEISFSLQPLFELIGDGLRHALLNVTAVLKLVVESVARTVESLYPFIEALKNLSDFIFNIDQWLWKLLGVDLEKGFSTKGESANYKTSLDTWEISTNKISSIAKDVHSISEDISKIATDSSRTEVDVEQHITFEARPSDPVAEFTKPLRKRLLIGSLKLFNDIGSWIGDAASSAWNWIKGLFKEDGGTLGKGAQIWGMNEQGNPEFLFNAGGHDTVINSDILANAVAEGVKRAQGAGVSRIEVSVKEGVSAGPKALAQWVLPSLKFSLKG